MKAQRRGEIERKKLALRVLLKKTISKPPKYIEVIVIIHIIFSIEVIWFN